MQISEHFSGISKLADHMAIVRSMTSKEGDHGRRPTCCAPAMCRKGPSSTLPWHWCPKNSATTMRSCPTLSAWPLPICQRQGFCLWVPLAAARLADRGRGAVSAQAAPADIDDALKVQDLPCRQTFALRADARVQMLRQIEREFLALHPDLSVTSHQALTKGRRAISRRQSLRPARRLRRDAYGRNLFRPGMPAGPPAGRAARAVCRSVAEWLGHAQQ